MTAKIKKRCLNRTSVAGARVANRNWHVWGEFGGQICDAGTQYLQAVLIRQEQVSFSILYYSPNMIGIARDSMFQIGYNTWTSQSISVRAGDRHVRTGHEWPQRTADSKYKQRNILILLLHTGARTHLARKPPPSTVVDRFGYN